MSRARYLSFAPEARCRSVALQARCRSVALQARCLVLAAIVAACGGKAKSKPDASASPPVSAPTAYALPEKDPDLALQVDGCRELGLAHIGKDWILYAGTEELRFARLEPDRIVPLDVPPLPLGANRTYFGASEVIESVDGPDVAHLSVTFGGYHGSYGEHSVRTVHRTPNGTWDPRDVPSADVAERRTLTAPRPWRNGSTLAAETCSDGRPECEVHYEVDGAPFTAAPDLLADAKQWIFFTDFAAFPSGEVFTFTNFFSKGQSWERHAHVTLAEGQKPLHKKLLHPGGEEGTYARPDILALAPDDFWVLWSNAVFRFDGRAWAEPKLPLHPEEHVSLLREGVHKGLVIITDEGRVLERNGATFVDISPETPKVVEAADGFAGGHPWLALADQTLRRRTGTEWTSVTLPHGRYAGEALAVSQIWSVGADDAWVLTNTRGGLAEQERALFTSHPRKGALRCNRPEPGWGRALRSWASPATSECAAPLVVVAEADADRGASARAVTAALSHSDALGRAEVGFFDVAGTTYVGVRAQDLSKSKAVEGALQRQGIRPLDVVCAPAIALTAPPVSSAAPAASSR